MTGRVLSRIFSKDLSHTTCSCGKSQVWNGQIVLFPGKIKCFRNIPNRSISKVHEPPHKFRNAPRTKPLVYPNSLALNIFLSLMPCCAIGIAFLQYQRKQKLLELTNRVKEQTGKPPTPVSRLVNESDQRKYEFSFVELEGEFDHEREVLVGYRASLLPELAPKGTRWQKGAHIITPFKLKATGDVILVNRGWVPMEWLDPKKRTAGQITGTVKITGLLRATEMKNPFDFRPTQDSLNEKFFSYFDVETIAGYLGTKHVCVDVDLESSIWGGPIGGQTKIMHRNTKRDETLVFFMLVGILGLFWYTKVYPQRAAKRYVEMYYKNKPYAI
ncbi:surfeit locus protein 1-like isoform X2 [Ostrea edulis]|uniref:surfeit locus protein 1-like isoform X2 n=1 Tax=Ostrea edulis TaxID=37623 RepID=UPI0024AF3DDF|nr:surfeit locus protein 1-like isoform X2 [Ostrea edulis]